MESPPPLSASPPKSALAILGWGGAWLLAGSGTGAAALANSRQLAGMEMLSPSDLQELNLRQENLNTATGVLLVAGGIATVAGASWLIAWRVKSRQAPR